MTIDIQLNISIRTHIDKHARLILDIRASLTESPPVDSTHVWWRIELFFGTIWETLIDWKYENSLSLCSYSVFLFQVFFKSISTSKYNVSTLPETNLSHLKTVRNHPQKGKDDIIIKSSSHHHQGSHFSQGGFGPSFYSFQGQLVTHPPTRILGPGGWVVVKSPPGKHRQVYLIGAADRASNLPTECGVVYLRTDGWTDGWESQTSWDKHVNFFRCHDFFGCPGKKQRKENNQFVLNECVYNHDSLASKNWCNNKRPDVTKHDFPVRYIHSHHCF